ncbi:FIG123464: Polysaccharide export protein [hydrothermal vent metagenome]|uniref:FIG123464: Polysaccharide export protein n=1 Tax=hydrothermal vent metagenome TaxID=652676 RepID=A0A3B1AIX7_9ZZZZ
MSSYKVVTRLIGIGLIVVLSACSSTPNSTSDGLDKPVASSVSEYLIGAGDQLNVFVWRNSDISITIPVRPDGRISTPLVEDMIAVGKTPTRLARDIEKRISKYIRNPQVTVIVTNFVGSLKQQIRVIGQATRPQSLPYRKQLTLLDVMIQVGGLTEFAAGNKAKIIRTTNGANTEISARLNDLIKSGDIGANRVMHPGDILIIPESWF